MAAAKKVPNEGFRTSINEMIEIVEIVRNVEKANGNGDVSMSRAEIEVTNYGHGSVIGTLRYNDGDGEWDFEAS